MLRGAFLIVVLIIGGIVWVIKSFFLGETDTKFTDETRKVMTKTAQGVNWMNEEWEKAKREAEQRYK